MIPPRRIRHVPGERRLFAHMERGRRERRRERLFLLLSVVWHFTILAMAALAVTALWAHVAGILP